MSELKNLCQTASVAREDLPAILIHYKIIIILKDLSLLNDLWEAVELGKFAMASHGITQLGSWWSSGRNLSMQL